MASTTGICTTLQKVTSVVPAPRLGDGRPPRTHRRCVARRAASTPPSSKMSCHSLITFIGQFQGGVHGGWLGCRLMRYQGSRFLAQCTRAVAYHLSLNLSAIVTTGCHKGDVHPSPLWNDGFEFSFSLMYDSLFSAARSRGMYTRSVRRSTSACTSLLDLESFVSMGSLSCRTSSSFCKTLASIASWWRARIRESSNQPSLGTSASGGSRTRREHAWCATQRRPSPWRIPCDWVLEAAVRWPSGAERRETTKLCHDSQARFTWKDQVCNNVSCLGSSIREHLNLRLCVRQHSEVLQVLIREPPFSPERWVPMKSLAKKALTKSLFDGNTRLRLLEPHSMRNLFARESSFCLWCADSL